MVSSPESTPHSEQLHESYDRLAMAPAALQARQQPEGIYHIVRSLVLWQVFKIFFLRTASQDQQRLDAACAEGALSYLRPFEYRGWSLPFLASKMSVCIRSPTIRMRLLSTLGNLVKAAKSGIEHILSTLAWKALLTS